MPHPNGGKGNMFQTYCNFNEAYLFICKNEPYSFKSTTDNDVIARIGKSRNGDKTIVFPGHGSVCVSCWGYRRNCSNTRIGHCVEILSMQISLNRNVNIEELTKFDLSFPGHWVEGADRTWALESHHTLRLIKDLFEEAVAAYSRFDPLTPENYKEKSNENIYSRCLNSIYAKAYVFALNGINNLLFKLCKYLRPPKQVEVFKAEYESRFGHLKYIRDSAIHIEDRGRGKTRNEVPLNARFIVLGGFANNCFTFTGEDGKQYEIEICQATLLSAKEIIQNVINAYTWF